MAQKTTSKRAGAAKAKSPARKAAAKSAAKPAKKAPAKKVAAKKPAAQPAKKAAAKKPAGKAVKAPAKKSASKAVKAPAKKAAAKAPARKAAAKAPARGAAKKVAAKKPAAKKAAAKKPAARKPKTAATAPAPSARAHVVRAQPETLRLRGTMPGFTVGDMQKSMAFYVDGLGFTIKDRWEKDGVLQGLMLIAGNCELALMQDDWAKGRDRVKGIGCRLYLDTVQDVDALAARAQEHGIAVDGPHDSSWGPRMVGVTDPDGFNLTFQRYTPK